MCVQGKHWGSGVHNFFSQVVMQNRSEAAVTPILDHYQKEVFRDIVVCGSQDSSWIRVRTLDQYKGSFDNIQLTSIQTES